MRVVSWNMRRATTESPSWRYLEEMNPDIALLQEVVSIPATMESSYSIVYRHAQGKTGRSQNFGTAILVRGIIHEELVLTSEWKWVTQQLEHFRGNLVAATVSVGSGCVFPVLSVHSPAWPIAPATYKGVDTGPFQLKNSSDLWVTEILWAALKRHAVTSAPWVVGGDFNTSPTFDTLWPGGPHGNYEVLDRLAQLGLVECLRSSQGKLVPTFRNPRGGKIIHQIDHLFVAAELAASLEGCVIGDEGLVFGESLSDHLPIIADFVTGET